MKDTTEIIVVLDKSSSMDVVRGATIEGFNKFVKEQQAIPGKANLTLVLFDTTYTVGQRQPLAHVVPLNADTYLPSGCTALLDAMGKAITETGKRLADTPEAARPNKVIMVVITDGEENSSQEHSRLQISNMVRHQEEKYNWKFLFLGANIDSFHEARMVGIQKHMAANFAHTPKGVIQAYNCSSEAVRSYRTSGQVDPNWSKPLTDDDPVSVTSTGDSSESSS